MKINKSSLVKIIREELVRSLYEENEEELNQSNVDDATKAAGDAVSELSKRSSSIDVASLTKLCSDILGGQKIITSGKNNVDENLFVNLILGIYQKKSGKDIDLISFPPTTYPESGVNAVQQALKLQVDGDFGRQTLAAAVTGGKIKLPPTFLKKVHADPQFKSKIARMIAMMTKVVTTNQKLFDKLDAQFTQAMSDVSIQPQETQQSQTTDTKTQK